ncbi:DUF6086 family protein [Streptomyces sp. NPDC049915]|uniref:DUF6086 family protein n=1 Tax=Streptomyces sp. NPDC049915 TaxID=3155510 RepID=UPI00343DCA3D
MSQVSVYQAELGLPSGIGPMQADECQIAPLAFKALRGIAKSLSRRRATAGPTHRQSLPLEVTKASDERVPEASSGRHAPEGTGFGHHVAVVHSSGHHSLGAGVVADPMDARGSLGDGETPVDRMSPAARDGDR